MKNSIQELRNILAQKEQSFREARAEAEPFIREMHKAENAVSVASKEIEIAIRNLPTFMEARDLFEDNGADDVFVADDTDWDIAEDDGTLHITFNNARGCFIHDDMMNKRDWNNEARRIMEAVGVPVELRKNGLR
jgi:hypothetical protein